MCKKRKNEMKRVGSVLAVVAGALFLTGSYSQAKTEEHGLVGLRPLSRTAELDHGRSHGGSWDGTPTYADQKGNYPFVAEHLDVIKGWLDGDFKTKRMLDGFNCVEFFNSTGRIV